MNDGVNLLSSPMFIQSHSNGNSVNAFEFYVQTVLYFVVLNKIAKPDYIMNWAFFKTQKYGIDGTYPCPVPKYAHGSPLFIFSFALDKYIQSIK